MKRCCRPAGSERDAFFATEADHVREFLRSQGYWEADVKIELHDDGKVPAGISLLVRVARGPSYPLGPLTVTGATALPVRSQPPARGSGIRPSITVICPPRHLGGCFLTGG